METFNKENALRWLNRKFAEYETRFKSSKSYEESTMLNGKMSMIEDMVAYISRTYTEDEEKHRRFVKDFNCGH